LDKIITAMKPAPFSSWKLRFAPHLGLTSLDTPWFKHTLKTDDPVAHIEHIAGLGFSGVEDNLLNLRSPSEQERIGSALRRHGLEMGCFVGNISDWNQPLWGRNDAESRARIRADLDRSISAASRTGGRSLTTITGRDPRVPIAYQQQHMIDNLRRVADHAAANGVVLGIEAVNERDFPGMLVNTITDAYRIVRAVDHPAVRLVFDLFHVQVTDGNVLAHLEACYDAIGVIQLADNPGRVEPGRGEINFTTILRYLHDRDYRGLVELEHAHFRPGASGEAASLTALIELNQSLSQQGHELL
jgi:hydroxypyruvate isomerase